MYSATCYADSDDLYTWEYKGIATGDEPQEGPNVFEFAEKYWLIADTGKGQAVYSSDDCEHFIRQNENILREDGLRKDDNFRGAHADVFVTGDRAFIIYFTHPDPNYHPRSAIQMAELKVVNGVLTCDRNAEIHCDWRS